MLGILSNQELHKLCSSLPGVPVSGTKAERIRRIIGVLRQPDHEGGVRRSLPR